MTANQDGYYITKSTDNGTTFSNLTRGLISGLSFDKEMILTDNSPASPYKNNLYCVWTGFNGITFNKSIDGGNTFTSLITIKNGAGTGSNIQTGANGEIYVCWADLGSATLPVHAANSLGFAKSLDGGQTFNQAKVVVPFTGNAIGDNPNPNFNNIRINNNPSMAVDKSGKGNNGRLYAVFSAKRNGTGNSVIYLTWSDDKGNTWSTPNIISYQNGLQSFFPWAAIDQTTGTLYVAYYCIDGNGFQTNTYLAVSNDGGNNFVNQKISDVPHTTQVINSFFGGYEGDYIGVTAYGGKAYVAWMDQRTGIWQNYVSEVDYTPTPTITGVPAFCSSSTYVATNVPTGKTVTWSASPVGVVSLSVSGNKVTLTKISQRFFTLSATINGAGTGTINLTTVPDCTSISSSMSGSCNGSYQTWFLSATPNMAATNWHWTVDNPSSANYNIYNPNAQSTYVSISGGGVGISVTYTDPCGETSYREGTTIYSPCARGMAFVVYPNPASSQLSVKFNTAPTGLQAISPDNATLSLSNTSFIAEVYDGQGRLLKKSQTKNNETELTFNTSDLVNGTYYLHIKAGTDVIEKQVYIKH